MIPYTKIQYIIDAKGDKQAVMIPIKDWEKMEQYYEEFIQFIAMKTQLKDAYIEAKGMIKGDIKEVSLNDFLNEC